MDCGEGPPREMCCVVVNDEDQYAVWPVRNPVPAKWRLVGFSGSRQECLDYVREAWTDMRPLGVRVRHDKPG